MPQKVLTSFLKDNSTVYTIIGCQSFSFNTGLVFISDEMPAVVSSNILSAPIFLFLLTLYYVSTKLNGAPQASEALLILLYSFLLLYL